MHKISRFHPGVRKFAELLESENTWEQITRKAICDKTQDKSFPGRVFSPIKVFCLKTRLACM